LPVATPGLDPKSEIKLKRQQADQTAAAEELAKKQKSQQYLDWMFWGKKAATREEI
jgi:hypothetical protein